MPARTSKRLRETLHDEAWLSARYVGDGMSATAIGRLIGVPTSTVTRTLRTQGLVTGLLQQQGPESKTCPTCGEVFLVGGRGRPPRNQVWCSRSCRMHQQTPRFTGSSAPRPRKNKDTLHNEAWLMRRYLAERQSTVQIAAELGCAVPSVTRALRKFDIPIRSMSEAKTGTTLRAILPPDEGAVLSSVEKGRQRNSRWRMQIKLEMVAAYGGKCACCGETEVTFLSLDHIGGGGLAHRGRAGGSDGILRDLKVRGWPQEGYRILCMNCNIATKYGRQCPHQI